jgi:hypothetical protein
MNVTNRELMAVLLELRTTTSDIKAILNEHAKSFAAHTAEDALLAHDVRQLARKQRGFVAGVVAATVAMGAGVFLALKWLVGGGK